MPRVADRPGIRDRPREPIELWNYERVAVANGGERLLETGAFAVASCHSVIEVDAIVANAELVQRMTLRGEVLPVGRAARVPDQDPGHRASRGRMSALKSRIVPPARGRIAMATGSRPMAHETPRSTSTTRETGLHDAIDRTLDRIRSNERRPACIST
jgi:hypothetical protein